MNGWQCPRCSYCYGPAQLGCTNCNRPDSEKYKTSTTVTITDPISCSTLNFCTCHCSVGTNVICPHCGKYKDYSVGVVKG